MNNWADARIVEPFLKDGHIVGLHIERNGTTSALYFSAIEDRMDARWNEIKKELKQLQEWWEKKTTLRSVDNVAYYSQSNNALLSERNHIEHLWIALRDYGHE